MKDAHEHGGIVHARVRSGSSLFGFTLLPFFPASVGFGCNALHAPFADKLGPVRHAIPMRTRIFAQGKPLIEGEGKCSCVSDGYGRHREVMREEIKRDRGRCRNNGRGSKHDGDHEEDGKKTFHWTPLCVRASIEIPSRNAKKNAM